VTPFQLSYVHGHIQHVDHVDILALWE